MGHWSRIFRGAVALGALACIWAGAAVAQQAAPGWIADSRTGCKVWNSSPKPNESITWSGPCANGLANGKGELQWFQAGRPGSRYSGEMRDGKNNGRGVLTWPDGRRYEGEFRDGLTDGHGVFSQNGHVFYEGEWRGGYWNGHGVITWPSGDRYEGEFRYGKPNGHGTYTRTGGDVYSGWWTNGCFRQGDRTATAFATKADCGFQ